MRSSITVPSTSSTPKHREIWASFRAQHHPKSLDGGKIVQHQPGDGQGLEVVDGAGAGQIAQAAVGGVEGQGKARKPWVSSLGFSQSDKMIDLLRHGLPVAIEHGGVGIEIQPMRHLGHLNPAVGRKLLRAHTLADPGTEDLGAAAGEGPQARLFQGRQGLGHAQVGSLGQMGHLHRVKAWR